MSRHVEVVCSTSNSLTVTVAPGETASANFGDYQISGADVNSISGVVYDDANSNGKRDEGEVFLQTVDINLYNQNGLVVGTMQTASDGSYFFANLPPGVYKVMETNPDGYLSTTLDQVSVVLGSRTRAVVDFGDLQSTATMLTRQ